MDQILNHFVGAVMLTNMNPLFNSCSFFHYCVLETLFELLWDREAVITLFDSCVNMVSKPHTFPGGSQRSTPTTVGSRVSGHPVTHLLLLH